MADGLIYCIEKAIKNCRFTDNEYDNVFSISPSTIIKTYEKESNAKREYSFGKELKRNKVQVPEFYELMHVNKLKTRKRKIEWILSMEKINGKKITELEGEEKEEAVWQFKKEILKVIELNINPRKCFYTGNALFDQNKGKLYLIDFEEWEKAQESPLAKWNYTIFKNWFYHATKNREKLPFYSEAGIINL